MGRVLFYSRMVSYNLRTQRRMAAAVLKCGERRVYFDPRKNEDISMAMSRQGIRKLKEEGAIQKRLPNQRSRFTFRRRLAAKRKGRHCGPGRVRGKKGARVNPKDMWILRIRTLRRLLKKFRDDGKIDCHMYHTLYLRCKGNQYKNKRFLIEAIYNASAKDEQQKTLQIQQASRKQRAKVIQAK